MEIETKRLVLKSPSEDLAEMLLSFETRNKDFFKPWRPDRPKSFYKREDQRNILVEKKALFRAHKEFRFYIIRKTELTKIIGSFGFSNIIKGGFLSAYLGYQIDKEATRMGIITEALEAGIKFFFEDQKFHRIEANIMPRNVASICVVEKLGFLNEGLSPKYSKINGIWEDHLHYVKLNEAIE